MIGAYRVLFSSYFFPLLYVLEEFPTNVFVCISILGGEGGGILYVKGFNFMVMHTHGFWF